MTYQEALAYIHSVSWKGSMPGLERISELCSLLGEPQKKGRFIHVAGTNGKGSVSAMTASILKSSGYRTGLFTSPYLVDFCERMAVDGEYISHDDLIKVTERVKPYADRMAESPTEFELITAIAFEYFLYKKCDITVLECGMGGRLDSTNVIDPPVASVITNIALDHVSFLGNTPVLIANEKAGIIKRGSDTVFGGGRDEVEEVFIRKCNETGSAFINAEKEILLDDLHSSPEGISFKYKGKEYFVPLCGGYQKMNIRTVLALVESLRRQGYDITDEALRNGLAAVQWRGRFETLSSDPKVIFDGAHNPDGAAFTASTFNSLYPGKKAILVSGVMADKEYDIMAESFKKTADRAFVFKPDNPRALDAREYGNALKDKGIDAIPCSSPREALSLALSEAVASGSPVLCAGSLYMYGEILSALKELINK